MTGNASQFPPANCEVVEIMKYNLHYSGEIQVKQSFDFWRFGQVPLQQSPALHWYSGEIVKCNGPG